MNSPIWKFGVLDRFHSEQPFLHPSDSCNFLQNIGCQLKLSIFKAWREYAETGMSCQSHVQMRQGSSSFR